MKGFLLFAFMTSCLLSFAQLPNLVLPIGHTSNIQSMALSPNARYAATSASDKTVRLWDLRTGNLLQLLAGKIRDIHFVYFDSSSQKVFACSKDGKIKAWDIYSGQEILSADGQHGEVAMMKLSYNEKYIISAGVDGSAKIWDARNGSLLREVRLPGTMISGAGFVPGDEKFFTVSLDLVLRIWDRSSGRLLQEANGLRAFPFPVACSPDGRKIAITEKGAGFKIWDLLQNKWVTTVEYAPENLNTIQFIGNGRFLATGASDHTVRLWDPFTGREIMQLTDPDGEEINSLAESHDQRLLAAGGTAHIYIWELNDSKLLQRLSGHEQDIKNMFFYPDDKQLISSSWDNTSRIWNLTEGVCRTVLKGHTSDYRSIFFDRDFKYLLCGEGLFTNDKAWEPTLLQFTDLGNSNGLNREGISTKGEWYVCGSEIRRFPGGQMVKKLAVSRDDANQKSVFTNDGKWLVLAADEEDKKLHRLLIYKTGSWNLARTILLKSTTSFILGSPNSKYIFTAVPTESISCWELATGKLLFTLPFYVVLPEMFSFHPDGKSFALCPDDESIRVYDLPGGKPVKILKDLMLSPSLLEYSPDGKLLLSSTRSTNAKKGTIVWNSSNWRPVYELGNVIDPDSAIEDARFSPSGRYLLVCLANGNGEIRSAGSGELLKVLQGHTSVMYKLITDKEERVAYSLSADNTMRSWDISSGKPLAQFFVVDSLEYFARVEQGYYQASAKAARLLHYVDRKLNVISFEQLDVRLNRPDKVLEAIGNRDESLIKGYRKLWQKRMKKLGIDTASFNDSYTVPQCDFENRDNIAYEQQKEKLLVRIRGEDSINMLDRFNVWVNESPIFGQRGANIKGKSSKAIDTVITVILSEGENRIEASITNANGTESYRMPLVVKYMPAIKQSIATHFIGIGIDKFKDSKNDLQYSSKDIRDLSSKLREKYGNTIIIDTLFNENVNINNVKALKEKLKQSTVNDKVIIAYSGHGLLSKDFDYYLSTYDVNFQKPEENGLPYDELENLLDSIPARKKLMLIDACHSGEVDKDELVRINKASDSMHLTKGGITVAYESDGKLGMKNSFELMQNLFVNVGKSTGATIISAAAGTQFALERGDLKNGVFTYCILEAMENNKTMKISELKNIVGKRVEELTNGLQKPTSRNENIAVDWNLW